MNLTADCLRKALLGIAHIDGCDFSSKVFTSEEVSDIKESREWLIQQAIGAGEGIDWESIPDPRLRISCERKETK